jgi:hypothetical protein
MKRRTEILPLRKATFRTYKPSAASYRSRDPAGEKLLMGALKNPSTPKMFRIGTDTTGWEIQKDGDNLPSYRCVVLEEN